MEQTRHGLSSARMGRFNRIFLLQVLLMETVRCGLDGMVAMIVLLLLRGTVLVACNGKLQYFGHLMQRANSLEKTLMLGKTEGRRKRGMAEDEIVRWHNQLNGHEFEQTHPEDSVGQRNILKAMGLQRVSHVLTTEQQNGSGMNEMGPCGCALV